LEGREISLSVIPAKAGIQTKDTARNNCSIRHGRDCPGHPRRKAPEYLPSGQDTPPERGELPANTLQSMR
jgi:hypothetical protein